MQRFILQENVKLLRSRLETSTNDDEKRRIQTLLVAVERELALLACSEDGVLAPANAARRVADEPARAQLIAEFQRKYRDSPSLAVLIDPAPGLLFVEANEAYCQSTGFAHQDLIGQSIFYRFPENPDEPSAESVHKLYSCLRRVAETLQTGATELLRYDIPDADGVFQPRYWSLLTSPLLDDSGQLVLLRQEIEDVTEAVLRPRLSA